MKNPIYRILAVAYTMAFFAGFLTACGDGCLPSTTVRNDVVTDEVNRVSMNDELADRAVITAQEELLRLDVDHIVEHHHAYEVAYEPTATPGVRYLTHGQAFDYGYKQVKVEE